MPVSTVEALQAQARVEVNRIEAILAAIDVAHAARSRANEPDLSEAAEFLALEDLVKAEDALVALILEPGFAAYQRHLLDGLRGVIGGAA